MADTSLARDLARQVRGAVIGLGNPQYDAARRVWNGRIDRRPALVARCIDAVDVAAGLEFASAHHLPLAVRGGGHSCAGLAICDGGLVLDLSLMREIQVDPVARLATAAGGVLWADLDRATQTYGLATPGGTDSEVGIAGLTLGGGNGWLMGLLGATCDNLVAADVVLADGRCVTASETENSDLFWALRGGGGNFGVVTRFHYRLHDVGPNVIGGVVCYPWNTARDTLRRFHDWTRTAPDSVTAYACLIRDEAAQPVVAIGTCYAGPMAAAEPAIAPLRHLGTPSADLLRSMSYLELQSQFDAARPAGRRCAMRSHFMPAMSDNAIKVLIDGFGRAPSPLSAVIVEHCHGAIERVDPKATAFALRRNPFHMEILAFWEDPEADRSNLSWVETFLAATQPFSSGEVYVNSLDAGEEARVPEAYGGNWQRLRALRALKAEYDPDNLFCCNHNIPPL